MRSPPRERREMGGLSSRTLGSPPRQEKLPQRRDIGQGMRSVSPGPRVPIVPIVPIIEGAMGGSRMRSPPRERREMGGDSSRALGTGRREMGGDSSRTLGSGRQEKLPQRREMGGDSSQGMRSVLLGVPLVPMDRREMEAPRSLVTQQVEAPRSLVTQQVEAPRSLVRQPQDSRTLGSPPRDQKLLRGMELISGLRSTSHDSRTLGSPPRDQRLAQRRNLELTRGLRSPSRDSRPPGSPPRDQNIAQTREVEVTQGLRSPSRDTRPPGSPPNNQSLPQRRNLELTQGLRSPSHESRIPGSLPYPNLPQRRNIQVTPNHCSQHPQDSRPPGSPPNNQNLAQRNLELTPNLRSPSHHSIGLRSPSHDSRIPGSLPYPNLPQRRNLQVTPNDCSQHPQDSRPPVSPPNNQKPANLSTMRSLSATFSRPPGSPPNNENLPVKNLECDRVLCSQNAQRSRAHGSPPRDEKPCALYPPRDEKPCALYPPRNQKPCALYPPRNLRTMRSLSADFSREQKAVTSSPQPALRSRKSSPRGPQSSRSNLIPPSLSPRGPQARGQDLLRPSLSTQKRQFSETSSSAPTQTEKRSPLRSRSPLQPVQSRCPVLSNHITSDSDNKEISHGTVEAHHCRVNMNGDIFPYKALSDARNCVMVDNIAYQAESLLRVAFVMFGRPIRSSDDLITDDEIISNSNVPDIATSAGRPALGSKVIEEAVRVVAKWRRIDSRKRILKPGMRATICSSGVAWALGTEMQIVEVGWCIRDDCISPAVRAVISGECGKSFVLDADGLNLHYLQCI